MIKNYIKIAWRNLLRNKLYSVINIGGLAIGMAVSFMLLLYVYYEFSYDKFNINGNRLYEVFMNKPSNGEISTEGATPAPLASVMGKDFPEIEKVARVNSGDDVLVNYQDKAIKLNTLAADASLLDMFSFDFIYGNRQSALADESSIILTQSGAKAIFGNVNPMGRIINFDVKYPLKVTGVIKDNPKNSSFAFNGLISWQTLAAQHEWIKNSGWGNYSFTTYALLRPGVSVAGINSKIKNVFKQYNPADNDTRLFLYPFTRIHLYSEFKNGFSTGGGSIDTIRLFFFLSMGILLIACINFMNLSTARSERRAREVGIRKAIGARRFALVQQFMSESLLMALLAFMIALVLMILLLPAFNNIIRIKLDLPYDNIWAWAMVLGITLFTGLVSGSYPALFLSSFKPVKVLKGQLININPTIRPRQALVIIQFTFAICLILSSLFIYKQVNYIKNKPIGYDQRNVVEMDVEGSMVNQFESFRRDAIDAGAVTEGTISSGSITNNGSDDGPYTWGITWPGQLPGEEKLHFDQFATSYHFINTYGLKIIQGHDFIIGHPADENGVILNEAAVKTMHLKQPLGQQIKWQGQMRTVIGVVQNFISGSPYEPVKPTIIGFMKDWVSGIGLKLNPNASASKSLAVLKNIYKKYNPEYPFQYTFADKTFAKKFDNERLLGVMSTGFTCLAIIISCLGLFGLAAFSAEQRKKEIGIRKVLGANISSLWLKLSQEFIILVIISFIIGSAISWYNIQQWLAKYTYHTPLSIWVFAITLLISLIICLIAVSWQAIKAAWANPVESLRSE